MKEREQFLKRMKELLHARKSELLDILSRSSEKEFSTIGQVMDSADAASSLNQDKLTSSIQEAEIGEIKLVEEALSRLNKGEYGICTSCGEQISGKRLEYYPYAARCITCQEKLEG